MTPIDALASVRVAADLLEIPTARVLAMIAQRRIRAQTIRGTAYVSLAEVGQAIVREESNHDLFS